VLRFCLAARRRSDRSQAQLLSCPPQDAFLIVGFKWFEGGDDNAHSLVIIGGRFRHDLIRQWLAGNRKSEYWAYIKPNRLQQWRGPSLVLAANPEYAAVYQQAMGCQRLVGFHSQTIFVAQWGRSFRLPARPHFESIALTSLKT
jgi:hypothetical protein